MALSDDLLTAAEQVERLAMQVGRMEDAMPEVYLTADGARELILTLQKQLKDALAVIDEAIALVKSRTQEADASHAVAQHNWRVANRLEDEMKDWRNRAERAEANLAVLQREVESRAAETRNPHA